MKHIRKFNESNSEPLDIEYIKNCFIDFIDRREIRIKEYKKFISLVIHRPSIRKQNLTNTSIEKIILNNIKKFDKEKDSLNEFYLDIKNCIDKIKISYTIDYLIDLVTPNKVEIKIIK